MPKTGNLRRELIRVTKIDYYPHQTDKTAFRDELITIIWGVNEERKRVELHVKGCIPRFWVDEDPEEIEIDEEIKKYIVKVKKEGRSFIDNKELWCIYVKYPYGLIFQPLRSYFKNHYQADVYFHEAVRYFYGIKTYISIPYRKYSLSIGEVVPVDNPEKKIQTNDYILDIETSDTKGFAAPRNPSAEIRCLTLRSVETGEIWSGITKKVDKAIVEKLLKDKELVNEAVKHDEDVVPPLESNCRINIFEFYKGDREDNERELLNWFKSIFETLSITTIAEYGDYDHSYIIERVKLMNGNINLWNHKNKGNRQYYPRHIFKPITIGDLERFYEKFVGSAKASGRTALEWMGQEELGYGKFQRAGIDELYEKNPEFLMAYNMWDCILPDRVMKKCGELLEIHKEVCDYMGCNLESWNMPMLQWEAIVMHRLKNKEILPSIDTIIRDAGMEAGGFVTENAACGMFENMVELDNSGEYNAVVLTGNIDHKTLIRNDAELMQVENEGLRVAKFPSGRSYLLDVKGIIPEILKEMINKINEYKKLIKEAKAQLKELHKEPEKNKKEIEELEDRLEILDQLKYVPKSGTLSSTGLYGTGREGRKRPFRLAHGGMASDITECGRYHESWNKEFIESHSYNMRTNELWKHGEEQKVPIDEAPFNTPEEFLRLIVIGQDTDSCKCKIVGKLPDLKGREMETFLTKMGDCYCKELNKSFDEFAKKTLNVDKHYFMIKLDATYKKYFQWGANKNYVFKDFNDQIHYKGVRLVKRGTAFIIQEFMRKFFDIVMADIPVEEIKTKITELMRTYEADILAGKYTIECGEPRKTHTETLYWDSMTHSNTIFNKEFRMDEVAIFFPATAIVGHPLPKNKQVALEYGDDPIKFGIKLDYEEVLRKVKKSIETILLAIDKNATWENLVEGIEKGNIDDEELW
ncbi:DNA polymerase domain-containing protein [Sulfuricurvum sp.]|uniref:DNA polymerase domain-containing protein n=1 Tax=Sulfuricurvum sp. TaxID=2025608 RepID=UPI00356889E5